MRKKVVVGNWKMNKTFEEAHLFIQKITSVCSVDKIHCRTLIAPSFPLLSPMLSWAQGSSLEIGVQNIHDEEKGAFTGEVSALLVRGMGARFTLIGHSERRRLFQEGNAWIHKKVKRALAVGLEPILCFGETLEERESDQTKDVLQRQLLEALEGLHEEEVSKVLLAYEPVWAIGTGKTATASIAEEAHQFCRSVLEKKWGQKISHRLPILYGGSVTKDNAKTFREKEDIDGVLLGGASLEEGSFVDIINQFNE
ncbi:MAG: triose-phosphate isomerase [Rhabdochlamydiaceae bacterium]|nr:triose-phosphate isomerase [Rhabdochlamydiaceae bacterium]